jgi:20S proteasome subunit alpha 7
MHATILPDCACPPFALNPCLLASQGAEKLILSKMLVEHSNRRTFPVDRHAGAAIAGVAADGRAIINRAQQEATQYKSFYGEPIPGHVLAERVASFVHVFNLYWYVR